MRDSTSVGVYSDLGGGQRGRGEEDEGIGVPSEMPALLCRL